MYFQFTPCVQGVCGIVAHGHVFENSWPEGLQKRLQQSCFPKNSAKFLRTLILKNICERLLLPIIWWNAPIFRMTMWKVIPIKGSYNSVVLSNFIDFWWNCWHLKKYSGVSHYVNSVQGLLIRYVVNILFTY